MLIFDSAWCIETNRISFHRKIKIGRLEQSLPPLRPITCHFCLTQIFLEIFCRRHRDIRNTFWSSQLFYYRFIVKFTKLSSVFTLWKMLLFFLFACFCFCFFFLVFVLFWFFGNTSYKEYVALIVIIYGWENYN